ncbi:hypothetical protein ACRE_004440 [Hapsidospora chrysogenum ATCC 11550]|uniref:Uncharacterized protein n=1 Tax=Hapsidospora chrysogenum (strain ATCC 11550 / CBS 779.69 / DSM 880 / IAM 14645 / JCM 23072 / IMI 49137) TaxID=857340 RepID=A0A086TH80_HAPC1|nr:hypothetical protein ACRE_004440 [Hapsidospora chrysogenum ATCC 11550]
MATYLCHGFRWHRRTGIRPFVLVNDLADAAPDWILGPTTSALILKQLHKLYDFIPPPPDLPPTPRQPSPPPDPNSAAVPVDLRLPPPRVPPGEDKVRVHAWSAVKLLEEYDPEDLRVPSRPYAFVADFVTRIELHADVEEEMARYARRCAQVDNSWFARLRDEMQKDEKITWYVVVCGDDDRTDGLSVEGETEDGNEDELSETEDAEGKDERNGEATLPAARPKSSGSEGKAPALHPKPSRGESLRRLFRRKDPDAPPPVPSQPSGDA